MRTLLSLPVYPVYPLAVSKIDIHVSLNHPTGRVWSALTDARLLSQWLSPTDLQPIVGSVFSLIGGAGTGLPELIRGEVTSVVPRRMLVMTWRASFLQAQVAWELLPLDDGGCSLFVTQTGFGSGVVASTLPATGCCSPMPCPRCSTPWPCAPSRPNRWHPTR